MRLWMALFAASLTACAAPPAAPTATERDATALTTSGQPIRLPEGAARIVLWEYELPPGSRLPVHRHPFPRLAVVEAGTLEVTNVETGETKQYGPNELVVESIGAWHFGTNPGSTTVRLTVIDLLPVGATSNVELQE